MCESNKLVQAAGTEGNSQDYRNNDDRQLLVCITDGDRDAMRELYERHFDALMGFLCRQCGDETLAADIVQDTMLQVWRGAKSYSGKSSPKTWMFAIARNKLIDSLRAASKLTISDDFTDLVDEALSAEMVIQNAQDRARVMGCLSQLSRHHRAAIELAFFQGLSYEEISEIESVPVGTIKTRVHHAKKLLIRCLGQNG